MVLERAHDAGVEAIVVVAAEPDAWAPSAAIVDHGTPPPPVALRAAYGLHPHAVPGAAQAHWADLRRWLSTPGAAAVGEIGLDYHRGDVDRPRQREWFARQLDLAVEFHLPVILHERDAADDLLDVLRGTGLPPRGGVWHCFSGGPDVAAAALRLGLHLGFGGLVTFRAGTDAVRRAAAACPVERLLVETDAPYLAPEPHRGRRNEPARVADVVTCLCGIRGQTPEEIAVSTTVNAGLLFGGAGV